MEVVAEFGYEVVGADYAGKGKAEHHTEADQPENHNGKHKIGQILDGDIDAVLLAVSPDSRHMKPGCIKKTSTAETMTQKLSTMELPIT